MKYQERIHWDRHRPEFLKLGFIIALIITFMAFNYTSNPPMIEPFNEGPITEDFMLIPPITYQKLKPPKPPTIKNLTIDDIETQSDPISVESEKEIEFDENVSNFDVYQVDAISDQAPRVNIVEEEKVLNSPLIMAEQMPIYGKCNVDAEENIRRECTNENLIKHAYSYIKYPALAREYEIEGTVVVSFVVNKTGNIEDIHLVKDIGMGCGEEVLKAIKNLDRFYPGKQNGRSVSVIYRLPIKFSLQ